MSVEKCRIHGYPLMGAKVSGRNARIRGPGIPMKVGGAICEGFFFCKNVEGIRVRNICM